MLQSPRRRSLGRRPPSPGVQHGQDIQLRLRRQRIDDQVRQPCHRKLACAIYLPRPTEHREVTEHHRGLQNPADDAIRRALVILRDPVADRAQVVARLWREINVQA